MKLPDWDSVFVIFIFAVLSFLLYSGKVPFEWYAGIVTAILAYFGVRFGRIYERKRER